MRSNENTNQHHLVAWKVNYIVLSVWFFQNIAECDIFCKINFHVDGALHPAHVTTWYLYFSWLLGPDSGRSLAVSVHQLHTLADNDHLIVATLNLTTA